MLEDDTRWVMVGLKGNKTNEQNTETMAVTPNIGVSHRFVQIISVNFKSSFYPAAAPETASNLQDLSGPNAAWRLIWEDLKCSPQQSPKFLGVWNFKNGLNYVISILGSIFGNQPCLIQFWSVLTNHFSENPWWDVTSSVSLPPRIVMSTVEWENKTTHTGWRIKNMIFSTPKMVTKKKGIPPEMNSLVTDCSKDGWLDWLSLKQQNKQKKQNRLSSRERGSAFVKYWPYGFESPIVWCILLFFLMFNLNVCRQNWN